MSTQGKLERVLGDVDAPEPGRREHPLQERASIERDDLHLALRQGTDLCIESALARPLRMLEAREVKGTDVAAGSVSISGIWLVFLEGNSRAEFTREVDFDSVLHQARC